MVSKPAPNNPQILLLTNGWFVQAISATAVGFFDQNGTQQYSLSASTLGTPAGAIASTSLAFGGTGNPGKIVAASAQTQANLAPTTVTITPPAVAGTYRLTAYLDITTGTTITFKNNLVYHDPGGNATTDVPVWERENSTTLLVNPTANTADRFVQGPYMFSIDNSASAITIADAAGTYTTCNYFYTVILEQLI